MVERFFVTTAIDYASGEPHLGHLYEKLCADILARWNRKKGIETFFLTGLDEHGQKIYNKAKSEGKEPKEFVDEIEKRFQKLIALYNISNDYFIRTTNEEHKKFVQKKLQEAYENNDIYLGKYSGLYCIDCEKYYTEKEVEEDKLCPVHKKELIKLEDENYFFKLSKYQSEIIKLLEKNLLIPEQRKNEILKRLKEEPLEDISISRRKEQLIWGIELPFDKEHITYVWFDALLNYISALEINKKTEFWPCNYHIIGKDITWFHAVYWPAFLLSLRYKQPLKIFSHGFILDENMNKMSKSLGNSISPFELAEKYGTDEIRYILLTIGNPSNDIPFGENIIYDKLNNELNNDLGNLVSRIHVMTQKFFPEKTEYTYKGNLEKPEKELISSLEIYTEFDNYISKLEYKKAFDLVWNAIRETNKYINIKSPWNITIKEELENIITLLLNTINYLNEYIQIIMPNKSKEIEKQFNFKKNKKIDKFEIEKINIKLTEKRNLFKKIKKKEQNNKTNKQIEENKDPFEKLNLRTGHIIEVKKHPNSDKLYILKVKFTETEIRQIVTGLQKYYTKEELINKKAIFITNLKTAKLGGYESQGMLLAVENKEGECSILLSNLRINEPIKCGNLIAGNQETINFKKFQKVEMYSKNGKIYYKKKEIQGIQPDKKIDGKVC